MHRVRMSAEARHIYPAHIVAHLRRSGYYRPIYPALTDGATHCRSFGPTMTTRLEKAPASVRESGTSELLFVHRIFGR